MNWNAPASHCLMDTLRSGGMRFAVASPGSRNTPLVLAAREHEAIELQMVLDERAAGFFALGLARATQSPVGLICTSGSALTHYLPAIVEASLTRTPLLVLSADRPAHLQHSGAPQTIEQEGIFGDFVRWSAEGEAPEKKEAIRRWRSLALQALSHSLGGEPGPVHLNLAFDEPMWTPSVAQQEVPSGKWIAPHYLLSGLGAQELGQDIAGIKRGLIVCGPQTSNPREERNGRLARAVNRLSDLLGWPVLGEPGSGLLYGPHDKRSIVSTADTLLRSESFQAAALPDFVLRLGKLPTSKRLHQWLGSCARDKMAIVDGHGDWSDPSHGGHQLISAPITPFVEELAGCLGRITPDTSWQQLWHEAEQRVRIGLQATAEGDPIWEGNLARIIVTTQPKSANLMLGNSMPIRGVEMFGGLLEEPLNVYTSRGANGIDGNISTAMGIAVGSGQHTTLYCGDLTFLHDVGGLTSLKSQKGSLRVIVANNNGGGIFHHLPISAHKEAFEDCFATPQHSTELTQICSGLGIPVRVATTTGELNDALTRPAETLEIVLANFDRYENKQTFDKAIAGVVSDLTTFVERKREGA